MNISHEIESHFDEMVAIRRHMHENPEISFHENNTKEYIFEQIEQLGFDINRDVGGNGLTARLQVNDDYPTVALRADFDALPIEDGKDVPYKSKNPGVMHACGHDAHTAMLITTARILNDHQDELPVNIVFIHQHAEELLPGGAKSMVEAGALDDVDYVYGIHVSSAYPVGMLAYSYGYKHAGADSFNIKVKGNGGHGAAPHESVDPVVASASLIQQLQTIVSRSVDPLKSAVVTAGMFNAGVAFNVIPDSTEIAGTVRTFDKDVKNVVVSRLREILKGIEVSFNVTCELEYNDGYLPVLNDSKEMERVLNTQKDTKYITELNEVEPSMGGEDFAYFLQEKPGAFYNIGTQNKVIGADYPHHHPMFDIDEEGMKAGVESFLNLILNFNK
jgi:amidohydrolase